MRLTWLISLKEWLKRQYYVDYRYPRLYPLSKIDSFMGSHPNLIEPVRIEVGVFMNADPKIGRYTSITSGCIIGRNCSSIGSFCSIARNCILGPNYHPVDKFTTSAAFYSPKWNLVSRDMRDQFNGSDKTTVINNDVWIGANSIVLGGVTIGNGVIIGAGAVVTKDVPDYAIVGGAPARIIRKRFSDEIIQDLLELKWWLLNDQIIAQAWMQPDIKGSIEFLKSSKK